MKTRDAWKAEQEASALFTHREGESPMLKFVQVGEANRINLAFQSKVLIALRIFGDYMGFSSWLKPFCDHIEDYQTTCGAPHAAREMLLEAIQFDRLATHEKNKSSITLNAAGGQK